MGKREHERLLAEHRAARAAERDEHEAQLEYWIWYWTDEVPPAQQMWMNYNYFRNQG